MSAQGYYTSQWLEHERKRKSWRNAKIACAVMLVSFYALMVIDGMWS